MSKLPARFLQKKQNLKFVSVYVTRAKLKRSFKAYLSIILQLQMPHIFSDMHNQKTCRLEVDTSELFRSSGPVQVYSIHIRGDKWCPAPRIERPPESLSHQSSDLDHPPFYLQYVLQVENSWAAPCAVLNSGHITHICLVDPSILINWKIPFPIFGVSGVLFHVYSISNRYSC